MIVIARRVWTVELTARRTTQLSDPPYSVRCMQATPSLDGRTGIAQAELAQRSGAKMSVLALVEAGHLRSNLAIMGRVAEVLGCDAELAIYERTTA
jgi:hypothetical protein